MEISRVGEALLRSSQPLLPYLAPSASRASHATRAAVPFARQCRASRGQCAATRSFTTSRSQRQQGAAAARAPESDYQSPTDFPSTTPSSRSGTDNLASFLDETLDFKKGSPGSASSRPSRFSSRNAQANKPPSRARARQFPAPEPGNSMTDLLRSINQPRTSASPAPQGASTNSVEHIFAEINGLTSPGASLSAPAPEENVRPMKLGPSLGRTIAVDPARGVDVGRAFRTLEMECARNSVRRDFMRQRFHERPGLKRKRLKSERWRRNFKKNFKGIVAMVQQMRKQGW